MSKAWMQWVAFSLACPWVAGMPLIWPSPALAQSSAVQRARELQQPQTATPTPAAKPKAAPATPQPRSIEFKAPAAPSGSTSTVPAGVNPQVLAEWHIQQNVCNGHLSEEELASLYPLINPQLVKKVCNQ